MKLSGAATPYFNLGLQRTGEQGQYHFMSTRNNNFSNRGQKLKISIEKEALATAEIAAIAAGCRAILVCSPVYSWM